MRNKTQIIHIVLAAVVLLSVQTFASGRISGIRYVNGSAELTIETTPEKRYEIQCCTDLADGEWIGVRNFIATSGITVLSIESPAPSCFFRVSVGGFATGKITGIQYINGSAELTIETAPERRYEIQCCTDLAGGEWISVRGFIAISGITVQSIESSAPSCFFRVMEIEEVTITPPPPPTPPPPSPPSPL